LTEETDGGADRSTGSDRGGFATFTISQSEHFGWIESTEEMIHFLYFFSCICISHHILGTMHEIGMGRDYTNIDFLFSF